VIVSLFKYKFAAIYIDLEYVYKHLPPFILSQEGYIQIQQVKYIKSSNLVNPKGIIQVEADVCIHATDKYN